MSNYRCGHCKTEFGRDFEAVKDHSITDHKFPWIEKRMRGGVNWYTCAGGSPEPPVPVAGSPAMPLAEGRKDDSDKVRLELIPPELLFAVGDVLSFGARKYADRNWERGMNWSRVFGALMRHMWAWWSGEHLDKETGKSHLWHAGCCIAFLIAYEARGTGTDDRPEKSVKGS